MARHAGIVDVLRPRGLGPRFLTEAAQEDDGPPLLVTGTVHAFA